MLFRSLMTMAVLAVASGAFAGQGGAVRLPSSREAPPCPVSTDPEYGRTLEKPVRIGGGAAYVKAREGRYLQALRGPDGELVTIGSRASSRSPDGETIIDVWQISYQGLDEPISVYLDAYHFAEPMAPMGFTCTGFRLTPPPIDLFMAGTLQTRLAIEHGSRDELEPIPLGADGTSQHGVAFDRFRMIAGTARAATEAGAPLDPGNLPSEVQTTPLVVVAFPLLCGERRVTPESIDLVPRQGAPVRRRGDPATGAELDKLVPGYAAPEGSLAAAFDIGMPRPIDSVRITYDREVCDSTERAVLLTPAHARARGVDLSPPAFPEGVERIDEPVLLQVVVDLDGTFKQPRYIGGPESLVEAAMTAIRDWRAEPARLNGAPVVSDTLLLVRFR